MSNAEQKQQEVILAKGHTHNGVYLNAGTKIIVNPAEYDFLKKARVIAELAQPKPKVD